MEYRKEIDGLRALAVIPVVFYHAGISFFKGGFLGVDIFFVISGYLITTIIFKEISNNTFTVLNFYERRARRIIPILLFVIIISSILSFIFFTRTELGSFSKSVISSLTFLSNLYFWKSSPYFQSESELIPLLHTWSLSIEEQFYILFPLLLIFFYKFNKKYIFHFLIFSTLISFSISQYLTLNIEGTFNFYFTISRIWEIGAGCLASYYLHIKLINKYERFNNLLSMLGLLLIMSSFIFFNQKIPHPSLYTFIPIIGTLLIILFAKQGTLVNKLLSTRILVFIGLISYSLYLWHQPLFAFSKTYFGSIELNYKLLLIFISLIVSIFSYLYIEQPFRNKKIINLKKFIKIILSTYVVVFFFHIVNSITFSAYSTNSTEAQVAKILSENEAVYSFKMNERQFIKNRIILNNDKINTLIVGSSRAMEVANNIFDEKSLNLSVSGASIEDQITIVGMALEKFKFNKIILGADPWLFNEYSNQKRWKSLSKEYDLILKQIINEKIIFDSLNIKKENDTLAFFANFLFGIYEFINIKNLNRELNEKKLNKNLGVIYRDGRRIPSIKDSNFEINGRIIKYSMDPYKFSKNKYQLYEKFINYLKNIYNIDVTLLLTPYHKKSYKLTINEIEAYLDVEKKFRLIADKNQINFLGSYNPEIYNCKTDEFYDDYHPNERCMKKIFLND
ncbi:acyltransferase family protein [Candidatus Pelagibacter sp.]|nr:acyltransferase family protein [Candidatus Pelagibacter sp.]